MTHRRDQRQSSETRVQGRDPQGANIDVDEKGTTASAATAVVMEASSAPADQVTLTVDRPFLFVLRDVPTGGIVFLGEIGDPSATR